MKKDHLVSEAYDLQYYFTCFYKIAPSEFHQYMQGLKTMFRYQQTLINAKILNLEEIIPRVLNYSLYSLDFLGVQQNIAVWKDVSII